MRLSPSIVLLRTQNDERLIALAAQGSEAAFTALVERYRRLVLRACARVLPEARAEDATQQAFLAAWKALDRGDEVHNVRAWLLRIARNTALNALRTPGFEYDELAASLHGSSAPQDELERREVMRQTLQGVAALPENQREALLRSAVDGASHADIARDLGLSEGATRNLVLRARATLRSAASAITPLPLLNWAAAGSTAGIAEVAAGGTAAGTAALLAKAGAVVVAAGGAVATPAIVHKVRGDQFAPAKAAQRPERERPSTPREERDVPVVADAERASEAAGTRAAQPGRHGGPGKARAPGVRRERGHRGRDGNSRPSSANDEDTASGTSGESPQESGDDSSGPGNGRGHAKVKDETDDVNSGPGNSGSGNSGQGSANSNGNSQGKSKSQGKGNPGSEDEDGAPAAAEPTPPPDGELDEDEVAGQEGDGGNKGRGKNEARRVPLAEARQAPM